MLRIRNEKGELHSILIFLFMTAISLFFLTMNYDVLKDIEPKGIKESTTPIERVIQEFAPEYNPEYKKEKGPKILRRKITSSQKLVYPFSQDPGGTIVPQKESPVLKTASSKSDSQQNVPVEQEKKIKSATGPVLIKNIQFRKAKNGAESVLVHSNRFFKPTVFGLEGDNPYGASLRMVIDIKNASYKKKGDSKINVTGKFIRRIRSSFNKNSLVCRIVLDLEPSNSYTADQIFLKDENIYILVVTEEKKNGGVKGEHRDKKSKEIGALESNHNQHSFKKRQQERRPVADLVEIEDISFRKAKNGTDTVLVRSNRFFEPTIFALEGK
ncbi:MAG: AMIN domain-containing protein, partial [Thermodesulfobacteriota bacterium]|nr:AMIN domain-containing protein [Thermodesulfobacteriota bacterium]